MTSTPKNLKFVFAGIFLFSQSTFVVADYDSRDPRKMHAYTVGKERCTLHLKARGGGNEHHDGSYEFSSFSDEIGRNNQSLIFKFHCVEDADRKYCEDEWSKTLANAYPPNLKVMNVVHYKNVNPALKAIVYAASISTAWPPRPRAVKYCLSSGVIAIEGSVFVGVENSHQAYRAIRILKTIRF